MGLVSLLTFKPTRLKISLDEKKMRPYDAIQVTICNAPYYGAHFQVAPDILMDDGTPAIVQVVMGALRVRVPSTHVLGSI